MRLSGKSAERDTGHLQMSMAFDSSIHMASSPDKARGIPGSRQFTASKRCNGSVEGIPVHKRFGFSAVFWHWPALSERRACCGVLGFPVFTGFLDQNVLKTVILL